MGCARRGDVGQGRILNCSATTDCDGRCRFDVHQTSQKLFETDDPKQMKQRSGDALLGWLNLLACLKSSVGTDTIGRGKTVIRFLMILRHCSTSIALSPNGWTDTSRGHADLPES